MIYFDNSATTKTSQRVAKVISDNLLDDSLFGNPGSLHKLGGIAEKEFSSIKAGIADVLGAKPSEIFMTSCGTESANTAISGYMKMNYKRMGRKVISTRTEHKATLEVLKQLEEQGFIVEFCPVDSDGKPSLEALENLIDNDTALLCFTHVNNETGSILPLEEIVKVKNSKNRNCAIYLDCVQSLGKLDIDFSKMGVDMASFSGHKIHSVKGVGVLYVRNSVRIAPFILGGGQQNGMRSGTESIVLAKAFYEALIEATQERKEVYERIMEINSYLREELSKRKALVLSPEDALPFVLNVSFEGFESETMLHCLESFEIYVSTVSACSSKTKHVSYVLLEMGVDRKIAANAVRLSFSRYNTMDEAREFVSIIDEIYKLYAVRK